VAEYVIQENNDQWAQEFDAIVDKLKAGDKITVPAYPIAAAIEAAIVTIHGTAAGIAIEVVSR